MTNLNHIKTADLVAELKGRPDLQIIHLELVPTDELIDEVSKRFDYGVFSLYGHDGDETIRRNEFFGGIVPVLGAAHALILRIEDDLRLITRKANDDEPDDNAG